MSRLLRYFAPDQTCFVTAVTARRERLLVDNMDLLQEALRAARRRSRFSLLAWVVLPDHTHALLRNPSGDTDRIVQRVKLSFSLKLRRRLGRSGPFWQHRYCDHIIRSDEDLKRHLDYIHYNPVKHELVSRPLEWSLSSYRRYCRRRFYPEDWGHNEIAFQGIDFGE